MRKNWQIFFYILFSLIYIVITSLAPFFELFVYYFTRVNLDIIYCIYLLLLVAKNFFHRTRARKHKVSSDDNVGFKSSGSGQFQGQLGGPANWWVSLRSPKYESRSRRHRKWATFYAGSTSERGKFQAQLSNEIARKTEERAFPPHPRQMFPCDGLRHFSRPRKLERQWGRRVSVRSYKYNV